MKRKDPQESGPEFPFVIGLASLDQQEKVYELEADSQACAALAKRFDLISIGFFRSVLRLRRLRGGDIRLRGTISAHVTQRCVVTLEPAEEDVEDQFEIIFRKDFQEDSFDPAADETVEPLTSDRLDIGEIAAEELSLALDPYPRAPGVDLPDEAQDSGPEEARENPFAALAALRGKK